MMATEPANRSTIDWGEEIDQIIAYREAGESLKDIADRYGVARQRIHQVLGQYKDRANPEALALRSVQARAQTAEAEYAALVEDVVDLLSDDPRMTLDDLVEELSEAGVEATYADVSRARREAIDSGRALYVPRREVSKRVSDAQLKRDLRRAAEAVKPKGSPLTIVKYQEWAKKHKDAVSTAVYVNRFGSWAEACRAARVRPGERVRSEYYSLEREDAVAWVALYLDSITSNPTYTGYEAWASDVDGAPSGSWIRHYGTWSDILIEAWDLLNTSGRPRALRHITRSGKVAGKITEQDRKTVILAHKEGLSVPDIAKQEGLTKGAVTQVLRSAGLIGGRRRNAVTPEQVARLYDRGWTYQAIADKYKISVGLVSKRLAEAGVTPRRR